MNFAYTAYRYFSSYLFLLFLPALWIYSGITGRYGKSIRQRIGMYPKDLVRKSSSGSPKIWIHAVSVGEAGLAVAVIEELRSLIPGCAVILSTTTEHGQDFAQKKIIASDLQTGIV